ncbi:hypothetical protein HZS_1563 [Henneguya salminicola]|nr:hypothetical protein HZS_1563 [Henneguya salminicola]
MPTGILYQKIQHILKYDQGKENLRRFIEEDTPDQSNVDALIETFIIKYSID